MPNWFISFLDFKMADLKACAMKPLKAKLKVVVHPVILSSIISISLVRLSYPIMTSMIEINDPESTKSLYVFVVYINLRLLQSRGRLFFQNEVWHKVRLTVIRRRKTQSTKDDFIFPTF